MKKCVRLLLAVLLTASLTAGDAVANQKTAASIAAEPSTYDTVPLKDVDGRTIILRGANFMAVEANGQPIDYERMTEWGFNVVRILMTWAALEPEQGAYDENYLPNVIEPQVTYAHDAGLLVIIDFHQFNWSACCGGMGMPEWICGDLPQMELEWLFQSGFFWGNQDYLDAFVAAWAKVAEFFTGDDRIFAYDLFNEPHDSLLTLPWTFENPFLRPLYVELIETIRAIHPDPYIVIEPSIVHGAGVFPFVMDPLPYERLIYSPHLYPGFTAVGGGYVFKKELIARQIDRMRKEAAEQGVPLWIGETGLGSSKYRADLYARDATDLMEDAMAHWTWWAFGYDDDSMGLCDASGQPKEEFFPYLSRPYPRTTAGNLHYFHFDVETRVFTTAFHNAEDQAPMMEIFVNQDYHYPEGFAVSSSDTDGTWSYSFDESTEILTVNFDPQTTAHALTIEPAK